MPKRKSTPAKADQGPSFEEALDGLESIVEAMENEQLPLEELVDCYEKGTRLIQRCESILDSARERIELITVGNKDETGLENPAPAGDSAADTSASGESDGSDDDIRLF